jgi:ESX secretion system protein EccD
LSASDPGLRRVCVHAGTAVVDVALPAGLPVAILIPSIVDILAGHDADSCGDLEAKRYLLSLPGASALDTSKTLAQHDIRDGAVLVLSQSWAPPPAPRYDDVAEAVSAALDTTDQPGSQPQHQHATRLVGAVVASCLTGIGGLALIRNAFGATATRYSDITVGVAVLASLVAVLLAATAHRAYRDPTAGFVLSVIGTAFAAVAGFLAVPGAPGIPNVLLAAMAAAATSVLAMRLSGCGFATLTAVSCLAMVVAVAALLGVITGAPLYTIGSVSALVSLGLLGIAARVAIVLAQLSPRLSPGAEVDSIESGGTCLAAKSIRADNWLASLLTAFSSSAAIGAIITVLAGVPPLRCIAFAAITGALLLLRARSVGGKRALALVISGIVTIGTTFGVAAIGRPEHGPWIAAVTAMLAAAAMYLGFVAPGMSLSPVASRSVELLECLALIAMVPLTCWICGVYGAVRGLPLK